MMQKQHHAFQDLTRWLCEVILDNLKDLSTPTLEEVYPETIKKPEMKEW